uniref:Uncharacterized protein n=1 Tax=Triticum urartu TaxID=4572 RepID=A0A8R7VAT1_TRIUA
MASIGESHARMYFSLTDHVCPCTYILYLYRHCLVRSESRNPFRPAASQSCLNSRAFHSLPAAESLLHRNRSWRTSDTSGLPFQNA